MSTLKRWVLAALVLLAAITFWVANWLDRDRDRQVDLPSARSDYTLQGFELLVMNDQGITSFQVQSSYLEKNPEDQSVDMEQPEMMLYDLGEPLWKIVADRGWISSDGKEILMGGAVEVTEQIAPATTVRTRDLTVNPDTRMARSDAAVHMVRPGMILNGKGFSADLKSRRYQILTNVQGTYENQQ